MARSRKLFQLGCGKRLGHGVIERQRFHLRAAIAQAVGKHVARLGRAPGALAGQLHPGERIEQALGHEALGQRRRVCRAARLGRRAGADGRYRDRRKRPGVGVERAEEAARRWGS